MVNDVCRDDDRLDFLFKQAVVSGCETAQSLGMKPGDVIRVKRYILVYVTPAFYLSLNKACFKIALHTKLGKLMDAYLERQGTEAAG